MRPLVRPTVTTTLPEGDLSSNGSSAMPAGAASKLSCFRSDAPGISLPSPGNVAPKRWPVALAAMPPNMLLLVIEIAVEFFRSIRFNSRLNLCADCNDDALPDHCAESGAIIALTQTRLGETIAIKAKLVDPSRDWLNHHISGRLHSTRSWRTGLGLLA